MVSAELEAGKDSRHQAWPKFVRRVNEIVASGELESVEIEYKLELGCEMAEARKSVLNDSADWVGKLENGGFRPRQGHPINWRSIQDLKTWFGNSPSDASEALKALWKRGDLPVADRIRAFNSKLPKHPEIRGKEGTRIRLIAGLLMGLDAKKYPPFATRTLTRAYKETGYPQPKGGADEADLYKHALAFLDQFLKEARAHGAQLHDRLDMQSVVWHWRRQPDDLPQLGIPPTESSNGLETENGRDGWDAFARRANELITSDGWNKKHIAPKLTIEVLAEQARRAVLVDAEEWPVLVKKIFTGEHVFFISREKVRSWIDESPKDALQALKASWTEDSLSEEQRIRAFGERFPEAIVSGKGSRMTVAATLLAAHDIRQFPPFSKKKYEYAYKQTGYDMPEKNADEAALYVHALGFLDRLIEMVQAHGVDLRHRLNAFAVVWNLVDSLPRIGTQPAKPKSVRALAEELLLPPDFLEEICTLLEDKRQVIFQGPPGTGKTFVAQELAKHLSESETGERVTPVQFHPSYAYEDFVRGFRPTLRERQAGYELRDGPLLRAAQKARDEPGAMHFLLIDEINRGNLAKLFGELYFLLEYRDEPIHMQYQEEDEEDFSLPENLYIIGTMNTADRSIALVDLALRRRFHFVEFHPDSEPVKCLLRRWLERQGLQETLGIVKVIERANELLQDDRHAAIGPSYFMKEDLDRKMVVRIWKHSIIPYIEECLFGDEDLIKEFDFEKLCTSVAPELLLNNSEEQTDTVADSEADGINNATDQLERVPGERQDITNGG
ncbi:MAG: AAA domain-containing protein [Caldilineaceae bacterium SB0668_bin_21]|nr:AAA domain-containing protein [Caldilineaceae bacterium SB0668_bin_21]